MLAAAGIASRRAAEELIDQGRVSVDGEVVRVQGMRVDPSAARIEVDGARVNVHPKLEYVVLNKPAGVVTTVNDPRGRRTVLDFIKTSRRLFPVGRLDVDTMGLVLLTNHGELAHRMTHPRFEVRRVYVAQVQGPMRPEAVARLTDEVMLDDGPARALSARVRSRSRTKTMIEISMGEGRNREVRRMLEAVGYPVVELVRVAFGPLRLGDLESGKSRRLAPAEVGEVLGSVGL